MNAEAETAVAAHLAKPEETILKSGRHTGRRLVDIPIQTLDAMVSGWKGAGRGEEPFWYVMQAEQRRRAEAGENLNIDRRTLLDDYAIAFLSGIIPSVVGNLPEDVAIVDFLPGTTAKADRIWFDVIDAAFFFAERCLEERIPKEDDFDD